MKRLAKGIQIKMIRQPVIDLARSGGFEPPTAWFVARYSIQLSYERPASTEVNYRDFRRMSQIRFLLTPPSKQTSIEVR